MCAISPNWTYDRRTRRWRRLNVDVLRLTDSPGGAQDVSLCDVSDRHDFCSIHSSSSTDSEGHDGHHKSHRKPAATTASSETSRSSSRCSSTNKTPSLDTSFSGPPSPGESGGGSSTMSLETEGCFPDKPPRKKCTSLLRKMEKLRLRGTTGLLPSGHSSESSMSSVSFSLFTQDYRNQINNNNNSSSSHESLVFHIPHGHKPGTFPTSLAHKHAILSPIIDDTSVNWRTGTSLATGGQDPSSSSAVPSPLAVVDHRASIYDNVPDHQQLSEGVGGCGGSGSDAERTGEESEVGQRPDSALNVFLHWSSEQSLPSLPTSPGVENQSVSQFLLLQKLSLLKLTALMDKYSPSSKQGWNWTVPKSVRKTKITEMKGRRVFGVPLLLSVQQTGEPLPPSILRALVYLKTECLDQVGLFRKSGVKSRIQYLRELSAFDVADMVKQYFRDLPEPIFTSKLCESFLHIYQYFPKDQQLVAAQAAILLLPDENREGLRTLLFFLRDVVACVDENQMTPTNIAVCLAPSLFHLNTLKRDANAASHRKYSLGRPDQRDLSENLAATQGLANMITEAQRLFQVQRPTTSSRVLAGSQSTQHLLKEAREKSRGWESHPAPEHVELAFKKMDDGCPLWMWRGSTEVDAPHKELLHRLLREQELWEGSLRQTAIIQTLSKDTEQKYKCKNFNFITSSSSPSSSSSTWQTDLTAGPLYLSSVSTEHPEVLAEGVRAQVHSCLYLLEPTGARKTRLTHLCRTDTRGRSQEWHSKVSGHLLASGLLSIRDSFRPEYKETKI
uniref:Si:dkeyp-23e4.3 n=1 Tax=Seriola lalandi dorsalis TaxID=1841481 RepID=A0A3B4YX00_SERLL